MIEWYIKQIIEEHLKSNPDNPVTLLLKAPDESVIAKIVVTDRNISLWEYERSKNTDDAEWDINTKRTDIEGFNKVLGSIHKVEIM